MNPYRIYDTTNQRWVGPWFNSFQLAYNYIKTMPEPESRANFEIYNLMLEVNTRSATAAEKARAILAKHEERAAR